MMQNEDASAGSLIGSITCISLLGVVFFALGRAVDKIVGVTNQLMLVLPMSQDAANTIYYLSVIFAALPFMYLVIVIINYLSTASDESSGGV